MILPATCSYGKQNSQFLNKFLLARMHSRAELTTTAFEV